MSIYVCLYRNTCMLVQVSTEAREEHQILWRWSYRWLQNTIMGTGKRTGILWESNMCSSVLSHFTSPEKILKLFYFFICVCVYVAYVCGYMCMYMCAEVRSQHQVFCPISFLHSV